MNKFNVLVISALVVFATMGFVMAAPNGATTVTPGADTSAGATVADSHDALAGNVTELTIDGETSTQSWQGYYGNITGVITLENSAGDTMFNWSLASPQGELYATNTSASVNWGSITCYNDTVDTNMVDLEGYFNIPTTAGDGANETFLDANAHEAFSVGSVSFVQGECPTAFVFDNTGASVDDNFEEVLLYDTSVHVFAALLEENTIGFDDNRHDFEMLVLEDGHSGDVSTTPYYFYVELE